LRLEFYEYPTVSFGKETTMRSQFGKFILGSPKPFAMPIGVYAGLEITGSSVKDAVTDPRKQADAVLALHERFNTQVMLTAMDLSVEAELFGALIRMEDDDIPNVIDRLVTNEQEVDQLRLPKAGQGRTAVHLEASRLLTVEGAGCPVLGGIIGPFSLAGRLYGVKEVLLLTMTGADLLEKLLLKTTEFLIDYVSAFRDQGVAGVIMAEPTAGLLSPRGLGRFSSAYVNQIIKKTCDENFTLVLHNCGAKLVHLPNALESGAEVLHFGAPMDIAGALEQVTPDVILSGNIDPAGVFYGGSRQEVDRATQALMKLTTNHKNFIPSSGCDLPPHVPLENLEAFFEGVDSF